MVLFSFFASSAGAATIDWDGGGGDDNWYTATNWNPDGVPSAGDEVTISPGANITLTSTSTVVVSTLTLTNTFTLNISTLSVTETLTVGTGVTVTHPAASINGLYISAGRLTINAGGKIDVIGKGYAGGVSGVNGNGPGAGGGFSGNGGGSGAGYGGKGGQSGSGAASGQVAGGLDRIIPGSGGGGGMSCGGGSGGGFAVINVSTLTIDGLVTADGNSGQPYFSSWGGGGGAGGGIYIDAGYIVGMGTISANGGTGPGDYNSTAGGGGGAGGRIAIRSGSINFNGVIKAYGGQGRQYGGAGTIYYVTQNRLVINNNNVTNGVYTSLGGSYSFSELVLGGYAKIDSSSTLAIAFPKLLIDGTTVYFSNIESINVSSLTLTNNGLLNLSASTLSVSGAFNDCLSGADLNLSNGGLILNSGQLNFAYSNLSLTGFLFQGAGTIDVSSLTVNAGGNLSAAGVTAGMLSNAGSLTVSSSVSAAEVSNSGSMTVSSSLSVSGTLVLNGGSIAAGSIAAPGIVLNGGTFTFTSPSVTISTLTVNGGTLTANTLTVSSMTHNSGTVVVSSLNVTGRDLVINSGAVLTHPAASTAGLFVAAKELVVNAGGKIDVKGKGYAGGASGANGNGPGGGGGYSGNGGGSGAGYGGKGGQSGSGAAAGPVAGRIDGVTLGSGGGGGYSTNGGSGGGFVLIEVSTLVINGQIIAEGGDGAVSGAWGGGGGAGGGIYIDAGYIIGAGTISANGGIGPGNYGSTGAGGGGGGGRIAVKSGSVNFNGVIKAYGGQGRQYGGAGTIYYVNESKLTIDNNNVSGAYTSLGGNHTFNWLAISDYAKVDSSSPLTMTVSTLTFGNACVLDVAGTLTLPMINGQTSEISLTSGTISATGFNGPAIDRLTLNRFNLTISATSISTITVTNSSNFGVGSLTVSSLTITNSSAMNVSGNLTVTDFQLANPGMLSVTGDFAQTGSGNITFSSALGTLIIGGNASFQNLTLDNYTLTASSLNITDQLLLKNGSLLKHAAGAADGLYVGAYRVTIDTGSRIDVTGLGYVGGGSQAAGSGPGGGAGVSVLGGGAGGGYGGNGGIGNGAGTRAAVSGTIDTVMSGSGGGGGSYCGGGAGGGSIRLAVSTLTLNGLIISEGTVGTIYSSLYSGGGGAGGGIYVKSDYIVGIGTISTNGGSGPAVTNQGGGGAGGRIVLETGSLGGFTGTIKSYGGSGYEAGGAGTIYYVTQNKLAVDNNSQNGSNTSLGGTYNLDALVVSRYAKIASSSTLNITVSTLSVTNLGSVNASGTLTPTLVNGQAGNDLVLSAGTILAGTFNRSLNSLTLDNFTLTIPGGSLASVSLSNASKLTVTGNLTVTALVFSGASTLDISGNLDYSPGGDVTFAAGTAKIGGLPPRWNNLTLDNAFTLSVSSLIVTNQLLIRTQSVLSQIAGDAQGLYVEARNITVDSTGRIDVSGQGSANGPGKGSNGGTDQYGDSEWGGGGGGFGGAGGSGSGWDYYYDQPIGGSPGGGSYGSLTDALYLGSGGGDYSAGSGGLGGGLARLFTSTLTLNGFVYANGGNGGYNGGGGSGGGIFVDASYVVGGGTIAANGGSGSNFGGSGGGGRILIYYVTSNFSGKVYASGANSGSKYIPLAKPSNLSLARQDDQQTIVWSSWTNEPAPRTSFSLSSFELGEQVRYNLQVSTYQNFTYTNTSTTSTPVAQGTTNYVIPGLRSGTTYYLRVRTVSFDGAVVSSWTYPANYPEYAVRIDTEPPTGHALSATAHISSCTLTVTPAIDPASGLHPLPYLVAYSTDSNFDPAVSTVTAWFSGLSLQTLALQPNTTYYFRMKARDNTPQESAWTTVITTATASFPPVAVANTYTAVSIGTITVNWGGNGDVSAEYRAESSTDASFGVTVTTSVGWQPDLFSWTRSGLEINTRYYYRAKARGTTGARRASEWLVLGSTWTLAVEVAPPALVPGDDEVNEVNIQVMISSTGADGGVNPEWTEYAIWADNPRWGWMQGNGSTGTAAVWYTKADWESGNRNMDKGLAPSTVHSYLVVARNGSGIEASPSAPANVTTPASAPVGVTVAEVDDDRLRVTWQAVNGVAKYRLYYSSVTDGAWDTYSEVLVPNTTYYDEIDGGIEQIGGVGLTSPSTYQMTISWGAAQLTDSATRYYRVSTVKSNGAESRKSGVGSGERYVSPVVREYKVVRDDAFVVVTGTDPLSYTDGGLLANTSYSYVVGGISSDDIESSSSAPVARYTLAHVAGTPALMNPTTASIEVYIDSRGNPAYTKYKILVSSDNWGSFAYMQYGGTLAATAVWQASGSWTNMMHNNGSNVRYRMKVVARNEDLVESSTSTESALYTLARVPLAGGTSVQSFTVIRATWTVNGNPAYTEYRCYYSSDAATGVYAASGWVAGTSFDAGSLSVNTSYYFLVNARNGDMVETSSAAIGWRWTEAAAPRPPLLASGYNGSHYIDTVIDVPDGNPSYTQYSIYIERGVTKGWLQGTGGLNNSNEVWYTKGEWETGLKNRYSSGLISSAEYQVKVRAKNGEGVVTVYSATSTVTTLPPKVTGVIITEIGNDVLTISWDSPGAGIIEYAVYFSSESGGAYTELGRTASLSIDDDIDGSTPTITTGLALSAVSSTTIRLDWDINGNALSSSATRYYKVGAFTSGGGGPLSDSATGYVSPVIKGYKLYKNGVYFASTVDPGATQYIDAALLPNTSASYQVSTISSDDLEGVLSGSETKYTHAALPGKPAVRGDWSSGYKYHAEIKISTNNNSGITQYAVTIDSGGYGSWWVQADSGIAPAEYWSNALSWLNKGLLPSTSYYYQVKARNQEGVETALSVGEAGFTPPIPGPQNFRLKSKTTGSLTWEWTSPDDDQVVGYRVYSSSGGGQLSVTMSTDTLEWTEGGLNPNSYYGRYAKGVDTGGTESYPSNTTGYYTLMPDPVGVTFFMVGETSITVNNSFAVPNISSGISGAYFTNVTSATNSGWVQVNGWTSGDLAPNTPYSFRVRLRNGEGIETPEGVVVTKYTLARVPGAAALYKPWDRALEVILNENANSTTTQYVIRVSSQGGAGMYVQDRGTWNVVGMGEMARTKGEWGEYIKIEGLSPVTTYYIEVQARNGEGVETGYSGTLVAATWGMAPTLKYEYDETNKHHVHVTISTEGYSSNMEYAIYSITNGSWFDGFTNLVADPPVYWPKATWESEHKNAQVNLQAGTKYEYRIRAKNTVTGEISESVEASIYTPLFAPNWNRIDEVNDDYLQLQWFGATGASGYNVYWSDVSSGTLNLLGYTVLTSYDNDIDGGPPAQVAGLGGVAVSSRAVSLSWSAVAAPLAESATRYYRVKAVNETGESMASVEYAGRVNPVVAGYRVYRDGSAVVTVSSATLSYEDGGLSPSTQYNYRIKAVSSDGIEGPESDAAVVVTSGAATGVSLTLLNSIREVDDDYIELKWLTAPGAVQYRVYYSTQSNGLLNYLGGASGIVYNDDIDGGYPGQVSEVAGVVESSSNVRLSWSGVGSPSNSERRYYRVCGVDGAGQEGNLSGELSEVVSPVIKGYRIYRNDVLVATAAASATGFVDTGLSPLTSYQYRISAISSDDLEGTLPLSTSVFTFPSGIAIPKDIYDLRVMELTGSNIRVTFGGITKREDGRELGGGFREYVVYRSVSPKGPWQKIKAIKKGEPTEFSDLHNGMMFYYKVRVKDTYNQESEGTMIVNTVREVVVTSVDERVNITFDDDSKNFLYGVNSTQSSVQIKIEKESAGGSGGNVLCSYAIKAVDAVTGSEMTEGITSGTRLGPKITIYYGSSSANPSPLAGEGRVKGSLGNAVVQPALFWHNGVKWMRLNGEVNADNQSVSIRAKLFGRYSVQLVERSPSFKVVQVEPKIFSPEETSTTIGKVRFSFENPANGEISSQIFDIEGREVRTNLPREFETVLYWDGKDNDGRTVPSGVYIYQIEADGKIENGTVVVAR